MKRPRPRRIGRHSRLLALLAFVLPLAVWAVWPRSTPGETETADELGELATADSWLAQARQLAESGDYLAAAEACERALELEPFRSEAQTDRTLFLARAGVPEPLMDWLDHLVLVNAVLADSLLDRTEFAAYRSHPRFPGIREEARMQAMD